MFTVEQKVNLIMRYIATQDNAQRDQLKKQVIEALGPDVAEVTTPTSNAIDDIDVILDLFKEVGMPPHLVGYNYTIEAIRLAMSDQTYLREISKRLYPDIAAKFNSTPKRVERAIRHAVTSIFDRGDADTIAEVFGNTMSIYRGKLTNSEFIAFCANEVERRKRKLDVAVL